MAHTGIYATSAECIDELGKGYNSTLVDEAAINRWSLQIESFINDLCRQVFATSSGTFTTLPSTTKHILSETAATFVGFKGAKVDASGYGSQREQENIMNVCWARFIQCIGLLKNQETVTFIK